MFWRWNEPWGFMETERGQHKSQLESLSQHLFHRTFWGDYSGDIVSRFYYTEILEMAPIAVMSVPAMHGKGLVLSWYVDYEDEAYRDQLREVIRFLAWFTEGSREYGHGELWDVDGFSNFEYELAWKEMDEGWWAKYVHDELVDHFEDWEDNTIVPEVGTPEWSALYYEYLQIEEGQFFPYWETADTLIVPGWDTEKVAEWLLDRYARSITEAGNPQPLPI